MSVSIFSSYKLKISLRYILPSRNHLFMSVISLLSLLGIVMGVCALIVVTSVMNGFRSELLDRILGMNGHIIIQSSTGIAEYPNILAKLAKDLRLEYSMPLLQNQAVVMLPNNKNSGALVRGIQEVDLKWMKNVSNHVLAGNFDNFSGAKVGIGAGMASRYGLAVGDTISIMSPQGDVTPMGNSPRTKSYTITAIYEIGMYEYDNAVIFMPFNEAQKFFNYKGLAQSIEIFLKDPDKVDEIKFDISNNISQNYNIVGWNEQNQAFFSALNVERNTMFIILTLIVLVASLNIISGLIMLVKDKKSDIAILRTMGASQSSILQIFLIVGMSIGIAGTIIGVIFALLICHNINNIQIFISRLFGVDVFNPKLYFLSSLPSKIDLREVIAIVAMTLTLSFLATIIPAWKASKLDPVEALRNE